MRSVIWSAVIALIAFAACLFLPTAALQNVWRIAEHMDMPDVVPVLAQLEGADIAPGYVPAAVCAAAVFALAYLLRRHKVAAGLLIVVAVAAGIVCALLAARSNSVSVYTIVKILVEYMRLGAF